MNLKDKTVLIYDYGLNVEFAARMARDFKEVKYFCQWEDAFPKSNKALVGEGFESLGSVIGLGNTVEEAIKKVAERADKIKAKEVVYTVSGLQEIADKTITKGRQYGINF